MRILKATNERMKKELYLENAQNVAHKYKYGWLLPARIYMHLSPFFVWAAHTHSNIW